MLAREAIASNYFITLYSILNYELRSSRQQAARLQKNTALNLRFILMQ
ncbi:hypothetical protein PPAR_a0103 [Pseudoalteromonas paragorgicola KMM 3548]|nr:hypothetical protein [Pseudoalteromonas distincta KMM 3548]